MEIRKSSIIALFQYVLLYMTIISHGANIYDANLPTIRYVFILVGVIVIFLKGHFERFYPVHALGVLMISFILMIAHMQPYFIMVGLRLIEPLVLLYATYIIDTEGFFKRYLRIVLLLSSVSLICYYLQIINPSALTSLLKPFSGWNGDTWYGLWFYTYRGYYAGIRNNGIFSEPGLFQMLANSAIALLLYFPKLFSPEKKRYWLFLFILIATVLTTGSTSGYIGLTICLLGMLLKRNFTNQDSGFRRRITTIIVLAFAIFFADYFIRGETSLLYTFVIDKFNDMGEVADASGTARTSVISICQDLLGMDVLRWLIGCGYTTVSQAMDMSGLKTAGAFIVYYMAASGLPATIFLLYPYLFRPFRNRGYVIECIVFLLLFFNTAVAQSREVYASLLLLPFAIEQYQSQINIEFKEDYISEGNEHL